ncbi:hypothetical protein ADK55_28780 [Streptomyces sp. WM4235]|nr:hypothetical protein ADK55_28780 [Streptomyces sp. WM4235]
MTFALLPSWVAVVGLLASTVWGWATWSEPVSMETTNTAGVTLLAHGLTVGTTVLGAVATLFLLFPRVFPGALAILLFLAGVVQIFNWQVARDLSGGMLYCALAVLCVVAAVASLLAPGQLPAKSAGKNAR